MSNRLGFRTGPFGRAYLSFALVALVAGPAHAQEPGTEVASRQSADALAADAYAILRSHCIDCHGNRTELAGDLDLRSEQGLRRGSGNGRVVIAHDPDSSPLYQSITRAARPYMPMGGEPLDDRQIETIRRWIETGGSLAGVPEARVALADRVASDRGSSEADSASLSRQITDDERAYWAFVPPSRPPVPESTEHTGSAIDAFLDRALRDAGVEPAPPADRYTLLRRASLDLLGLPPTPEQIQRFVNDPSPGAWDRLIDELLASPHYGERWARHWMDLVRYADSGGFEFDVDWPEMHRYRDYLIDSFNQDKPYDRFVMEQLAGDELSSPTDETMIATGYLRAGPEAGSGELDRLDALDDLITTTSLTFMGLTVGCARCHDHKFDPITQVDYYRMQAVFIGTRRASHPLVPKERVTAHRQERERIEALIEPIETEKEELEAPFLQIIIDREVAKLPEYLQVAWRTPPEERTEGQRLNVVQIEDTLSLGSLRKLVTEQHLIDLMPEDVRAEHARIKAKLADLEEQKPRRLPSARVIGERSRTPPPAHFLHRGSPGSKGPVMAPGVLEVTSSEEWPFPEPPAAAASSWRRRAFAEWLVSERNPLTARVIVNRLWQHHFGEGLVRTPNNLGRMGAPPTHPELLDWLAAELVERGWSLKALHRLMLTSEAYRRASIDLPAARAVDPENRLLWRMPRVRLEGEIIRDAVLASAGSLDRTVGGPSIFPYIDPELFEKSSKRDWPGVADSDPATWRRSLYVFSKRSIRYPLFETFDQPNLINSAGRRNRTTTAPQSLILMNNPMLFAQASRFAERLRREAGESVGEQIELAFLLALGRPASAGEISSAVSFIDEWGTSKETGDGLTAFCHLLYNLNEFLHRA